MTTTNNNVLAVNNHTFAVAMNLRSMYCIEVAEGQSMALVVRFQLGIDGWKEVGTPKPMTVETARGTYRDAKTSGRLLSSDAATDLVDGESTLCCLKQPGGSFWRSVKGNPFRYAQSCERRSGVSTTASFSCIRDR